MRIPAGATVGPFMLAPKQVLEIELGVGVGAKLGLVGRAEALHHKDFDLVLFPRAHHGYGDQANYMMRRRWDYFVENLMGATPPKEFRIVGPGAGK